MCHSILLWKVVSLTNIQLYWIPLVRTTTQQDTSIRWFTIRGRAWASMIWCFVMAHKPQITAGFVTVCCSMSMISTTLCSHFSSQGSYYGYTHALTKLPTEVMSWIWCLWVSLCMALTWSELNYCAWFVPSVSSLPLSVMVRSRIQ